MIQSLFRRWNAQLEQRTVAHPDRDLNLEARWGLLRQYGDFALAYPAVTEDYLSTYGSENGAITYAHKMGCAIALGDPLCAERDAPGLLAEFIEAFETPVFAACQERTARHLARFGYRVNGFGYDSVIDLKEHSFAGGKFKRIRYATNWLSTNGGKVVEERGREFSRDAVLRISREWRDQKTAQRELLFLNRKFTVAPSPETRRFYALNSLNEPLGFIGFDPIYSGGHTIGYLASQKRRVAEDTAYLDLAIMRHAIDTFQSEGLAAVHLGITPLADTKPPDFGRELGWLKHATAYAHRADWVDTRFFNSKGLEEYKNRFRGRRVPLYVCMPPKGSSALRMLALLVLIQVV